jgi:hypothetical protein
MAKSRWIVGMVTLVWVSLFSVTKLSAQMPATNMRTQMQNERMGLGADQQVNNNPFASEEESEEGAVADTTKKKERRPKQPLESYFFPDSVRGRQNMRWTVSPYVNEIDIGSIDTLQQDFQIQFPFQKKGVGSAYLGNLGAPSYYLSYFDRQRSRDHSFANPWSVYLRTAENMPFYNVKLPFTQLNYAWAGQKSRQEEDFGVIHAQNYSPQTGFNIDYKSFGTKGIYTWQATRDKTLSMAFSHTGKRYTIHAGYIYNSIYNRENGGIISDDEILVNIKEYQVSTNIPMMMSDPKNWVKNNSYFVTQSYGIPLRRVTEEDFTIADRPAVFVGHTLQYDRWVRKYQDTYSGTLHPELGNTNNSLPYYDKWYFNPTESRDSLFEGKLSNRVFVQIQPWDRGGVIGVINGGFGVDVLRYYQFNIKDYMAGSTKAHSETAYYAYASIRGRMGKYFDYTGDFKLHPFGYQGGDLEAGGAVSARVYIKGQPLSLSGRLRFTSLEPSWWEQNFNSNHYRGSNSFIKENETRLQVTLAAPQWGFELSGFQSVLGNKIYYGEDYLPAQAADVISVTGLYLREDMRVGIKSSSLNLNHRAMLQWSTNQKVIPVPMFSAYLSYFFEFNVVKNVLRLQVGVDGRFNTSYYAQGYNPGTAQFYNQREKQVGDYVWMDVFVNAKWKRMRILLKFQHLNDDLFGGRNYFSVLHYPMNQRIFKIGVSWNFYD